LNNEHSKIVETTRGNFEAIFGVRSLGEFPDKAGAERAIAERTRREELNCHEVFLRAGWGKMAE